MMNQYKIESYIADGETMSVSRVVYADTPEEAYRQYVISVFEKNEDGTKKFVSTRLYVGAYKQIDDVNGFFNIFKAN